MDKYANLVTTFLFKNYLSKETRSKSGKIERRSLFSA